MTKIKFGTDGWRAIIAQDFTTENVSRIAAGLALWIKEKKLPEKVVIGYDCRFAGKLFAETTAKVLKAYKLNIVLANNFVTTPMISLAAKKLNCGAGVIITASHNPPAYNGFKIKGNYGGPLLPELITEVESFIPDKLTIPWNEQKIETEELANLIELYQDEIKKHFDFETVNKSDIKIIFNAMYGSGQGVLQKLLSNYTGYNEEVNPTFFGISPEPIPKNLGDFLDYVKAEKRFDVGLIVDGDADRIALCDNKGNYINSHQIMLLLVYILIQNKGFTGKIATGFSSTSKLKKLASYFNLPIEIVPIGFKHICGLMISDDILMGGEESGGIAIKGFIPERDGIYNCLTVLSYLAKENITITEALNRVTAIVGTFFYNRIDIEITEDKKQQILTYLKSTNLIQLPGFKTQYKETLDGYKYYLNADEWFMIRASGTEPLIRLYCEAESETKVNEVLTKLRQKIIGVN